MYKWDVVNLKMHIGRIIQLYRLRKELSQFQLGLEVGMSRDHIGRIERGQTNPTIENIVKISDFLKIDILIFFTEVNQNEISSILDEIKNLKEKTRI